MKTQRHYESIQVLERLEDGRIKAWYPQEKFPSLREAKADVVRLSKEFPGVEYQVISVEIAEVGEPKKRAAAAPLPWTRADEEQMSAIADYAEGTIRGDA